MSGITQARNLPASKDVSLPAIKTLKGRDNYDTWIYYVESVLEQYNLSDLLNSSLPHPNEDDEKYALWKAHAGTVRTWLIMNVSEDIIRQLRSSVDPQKTPDVWMSTLEGIVHGNGHKWAHTVWMEAVYIRRRNYASVEQFVDDLRKKVDYSNKIDMPITAYQASSILLRNVEKEFKTYVDAKWILFDEKIAKKMGDHEFMRLCEEVKDYARGHAGQTAAAAPKTSSTQNTQSNSNSRSRRSRNSEESAGQDNNGSKKWMRNRPPKGANVEEYVADWLKQRKNPRGLCPYCTVGNHEPSKCYYLVPDIRPKGWKPFDDLWCYKWEPNGQTKQPAVSNLAANITYDSDSDANDFTNICGMALSMHAARASRWIADSGTSYSICNDRAQITEFEELVLGTRKAREYEYATANGQNATPLGTGKTLLRMKLDGGIINEFLIDCVWNPAAPCNLFAMEKAKEELGIYYDSKTNTIRDLDTDEPRGYT